MSQASILYKLIEENWLSQFHIEIDSLSNQSIDLLMRGEELQIKNKYGKIYSLLLRDAECVIELVSE